MSHQAGHASSKCFMTSFEREILTDLCVGVHRVMEDVNVVGEYIMSIKCIIRTWINTLQMNST